MFVIRRRTLTLCAAVTLTATAVRAQPVGPGGNISLPPEEIIHRLQSDPFVIETANGAGGGVMGAKKLGLRFPDGTQIDVKWKVTGSRGDGWNNSPRREIAAYAVQQLFLDPDDYTVPPVVARCIPLDVYRPIDDPPEANIERTRCVFGAMSAWLQDVTEPEDSFDRERFAKDSSYAYSFANLNLLTYLINHRDAREGNILISKNPNRPQLYSIDNGIAFGGVLFNFFRSHFDTIVVGGLPKQSVDRLRRLTPGQLSHLGILGQFELDESGVLQHVDPTVILNPELGTRLVPGKIQFGLTTHEIDALNERIQDVLKRVDSGELTTF